MSGPIVELPETGSGDESTPAAGPMVTVTGTLDVDYGATGIGANGAVPTGTVTAENNGIPVSLSALSSGGQNLSFTQDLDGYFAETASGTRVLEFSIDPTTGVYTYEQFEPLDHADASAANETIVIDFGVVAIDADGNRTQGSVDITIFDSAPSASADTVTFDGILAEPVDLLGNDDPGFDGGTVTSVTSGGTTYPVAATGTTQINLTEGTLVIGPDGTGTFTSANGLDALSLTYEVTDGDGDTATGSVTINCFAPGTLITTPQGQIPVEHLRPGDRLTTADGRVVPILWVGHQTVSKARAGAHMQPVRITANALRPGIPSADLTVTADHGFAVDGYLITAAALVNHRTIRFVPLDTLPDTLTYYHVETATHDILLANDAPAETFVDYCGRQSFDNYDAYLAACGADRLIPEHPLPRIAARRLVPAAIRARLDGLPVADLPDLRIPA